MTTEQKIEQELNDEYQKFQYETYAGKVPVPPAILTLFKKAYMCMAPQSHKVQALRIKSITDKKPLELTNNDLQAVVMMVLNTPPEKLYPTYDEAVSMHASFEKFALSYNNHVSDFEAKLRMRKATLNSLTLKPNMRVLPQA